MSPHLKMIVQCAKPARSSNDRHETAETAQQMLLVIAAPIAQSIGTKLGDETRETPHQANELSLGLWTASDPEPPAEHRAYSHRSQAVCPATITR
jgi:hypothetical protein